MMNPDPFNHAEDEYFRLKGQFATGRITREQFEAALKGLMAQDAEGRYWMMGVDSGKWYVHKDGQWIEGTPPGMQPAKPMTMPERGAPAPTPVSGAQPVPRARKTNSATLILLAALVIVGLGLGALFLWVNRVGTNAVTQPTGVALANATTTPAPEAVAASETPIPAPTSSATTLPSETPTPPLVSSNAPGVNAAVIPIAEPTPLQAKDFVTLNALLAEKISALNQAELKFIRDLQKTSYNGRESGFAFPPLAGSELTDQDLKDLAGKAMDVAILSDQLGEVAGKQDKGSAPAAQSADTYFAIARNALSLVVDSQELRGQLLNNYIPGAQGIQVIAEYGVQLWNAEVTDGGTEGNPFVPIAKNAQPGQTLNSNGAAQVQAQTNAGANAVWIAKSDTQMTRTLTIPPATAPVSPFDPQVQQGLTTAEGQSDGNKAQQVAGSMLTQLGVKTDGTDPGKPTQLQVPANAVAVAEKEKIKDGKIPSFPTGKAVIVSTDDSNGNPFMQAVGLNGEQPPTDGDKVTVQNASPLVSLTISSIDIEQVSQKPKGSGTFEAEVAYSFIVDWNTTLTSPRFNLDCISGNSQLISQPSGTKLIHSKSLMILYPGAIDAYCNASTVEGTQLGSANIRFLVGDAAGATQRAVQVETDSESLNRTFTAEAQGTENATQTQVAGTAQVIATQNALETEVSGTATAEFKLTADAFGTKQAQPPPPSDTPTVTPTFTPKLVETIVHPGNVMGVSGKVVLEQGHLYRFTFSGRVNLINPTKSAAAHDLPEHVNGVAVSASDVVLIEGNGSVAAITCGSGESDPNDPGSYTITVEDLGPQ